MKPKPGPRRGARAARPGGKRLPLRAATPARTTHRRSPEIIEAAAQIFAELGYHGATTQKIADVLRIRQASLYYYFPTKEVALERVCLRGVGGFFETARAIASGPGSPAERLTGLMRAHMTPILDRGNFVRVFLTQRQFLPTVSRRRVGKWSRGIEKMFESVIAEGIRAGEFRDDIDPRLATLAILGMCNAVASWYAKENAPIERIGRDFTALVLRGLAPATGHGKRRSRRRI